jgi:hypothetical protein
VSIKNSNLTGVCEAVKMPFSPLHSTCCARDIRGGRTDHGAGEEDGEAF